MPRFFIAVLGTALLLPAMARASDHSVPHPPVGEVYRQALLVAGLVGSQPESWRKKVRWKAALPQLRLTFQRDLKDQLKMTNKDNISISGGEVVIGPREQDFVRDFDSGTRIQATAVWYLDDLVFNREAVLVSQERRRMSEERHMLLERITKLYFGRLRALEKLRSGSSISKKKRRELHYLIQEQASQLDALTDGWFGRALIQESSG